MKQIIPVLLVSAMLASPCTAQLVITQEQADLETSAASTCPEDTPPEPDTDKHFVEKVVDTDTTLLSEMNSVCGAVAVSSWLSVTRTSSTLSGTAGTSSELDNHGGGVALLGAGLLFEVEQSTTYSLTCTGTTTETGDSHFGSMEFYIRGGSVDHASDGAENFDHTWNGTFEPGVVYAIYIGSVSERSARALPGGSFIWMDGETTQAISFTLMIDNTIVPIEETTCSAVKSRY